MPDVIDGTAPTCSTCGKLLPRTRVRFCPGCGAPLAAAPPAGPPPVIDLRQQEATVTQAHRRELQQRPPAPAVAPPERVAPRLPPPGAPSPRAIPPAPPPADPWPSRPVERPARRGPSRDRRVPLLPLFALTGLLAAGLVAGLLILHPFNRSPVAAPVSPSTAPVDAPSSSPSSVEPTPTTPPPSLSPTPTPTAPVVDEAAALAGLRDLHDGDASRVIPRGQWVAQIASKRVGTVDPYQRTASGSHRFEAADILAEHQDLRRRFGSRVVLLLSSDYGHDVRDPQGQVLWVTFYLGRFSSAHDVTAWCPRAFPELSGKALRNACAARRLRPPS